MSLASPLPIQNSYKNICSKGPFEVELLAIALLPLAKVADIKCFTDVDFREPKWKKIENLRRKTLCEGRIAWLDVMTWGFYASKEMQPSQTIAIAIGSNWQIL